jgi:hypothetical protein
MKKLFLTAMFVFGSISFSSANTIELLPLEENEVVVTTLTTEKDEQMLDIPGLAEIVAQISYCAQVQMDVKETYTDVFGPDRANSIALGAFMGCMGYL